MALPTQLLPTTVVGSYPQPDWLLNRQMLSKIVPRTRMQELWRIPAEFLEQAQDDATVLAIRDMERAGIDIITDSEMRRGAAVELRDMQFLRANTSLPAKITLPGPFTMGQQAKNDFYKDDEEMAMDFAAAVNAEALDLQKAGADIIQLDEPWLRNDPEAAKRYAVKAINRALQGITVPTVVHLCFGYAAVVPGASKPTGYSFLPALAETIAQQISIEAAQPKLDLGVLKDLAGKKIMLGVLDLGDNNVETPELVAQRIRAGLKYVKAENLIPAPDCGMKYLAREIAFGKLKALADGAAIVRREIL